MADARPGVGETHARLWDELPLVGVSGQRELQNTESRVVGGLARVVGAAGEPVVLHAARPNDELADAPALFHPSSRAQGCVALVVVIVAAQHELGVRVV